MADQQSLLGEARHASRRPPETPALPRLGEIAVPTLLSKLDGLGERDVR
jgi:hypothetical protein